MTSPWRSCVSVVTPSTNVPAYSLSSLMSRSCTFVPRPIVSSNRPVAIGSSVPQWPIFLVPSFRRVNATTSCDVIPSALSTSRMPSGSALNDVTNFLQNLFFHFAEAPANARAGSQCMPAAAELLANRANIDGFIFRSHADAHLAVRQFFEENGNDHAPDCPEMIDQSFVVFGKNAQICGSFQAEGKTCYSIVLHETRGLQKLSQQLEPASRIALVQLLTDFPHVEASSSHEFRGDLKRARAGFWILKRTCVSRNRGIKIFCNLVIEGKALALYQLEDDFSRGRRTWIDNDQIAIARIAEVMVDVDPNFCRRNSRERVAQPILNCGIKRDGDIEILSRRWRLGHQFGARQERIFFEHSVFIPDANLLVEFLKGERARELATERVTIRPNVTQDREVLVLAQDFADLLERSVAHSSSPLRFSRFCKISRTRAPRSMESSR